MGLLLALLLQAAQEARASAWGFAPDDATKALQSAIDSGAKKVVVEDMGRPWIVTPIRLAGDQEIVFEKGVVVQAKRGAFRGKNDCLFSAIARKNVALTGNGAALRMWKEDYHREYEKAEWRHCLSLRGCENVRVRGFTLAESGGDGVYVGVGPGKAPCRDVVLQDLVCDGNYRQGVSVISAENLLIENCVFRNTGGTPPQAGIEFEPNGASERLVNCVMRNCLSENNRGDGYVFYLKPLMGASTPVSIRLENCRASGNGGHPLRWVTRNEGPDGPTRGTADFVACVLEGSDRPGVMISENAAAGCRLRFERCRVADSARGSPELSPVTFSSSPAAAGNVGNAEFADCVVRDEAPRPPMALLDWTGGKRLERVSGTLIVERGGKSARYTLDSRTLAEWIPVLGLKDIPRVPLTGLKLEPAGAGAAPGAGGELRLRGASEFLLYAEAGREAAFTLRVFPVGAARAPVPVRVLSPSGKEIAVPKAPPGEKAPYAFRAEETGAYRILCEGGNASVVAESAAQRLTAVSGHGPFHFFRGGGTLYFWVPAGASEFAVKVIGGAIGESVKASIHDPAGRQVGEKDNIVKPHQFDVKRDDPSRGEAWSLRTGKPSEGVFEDYYVDLLGIPPLLAASPGALLRPAREQ